MKHKILVVDDEISIVTLLQYNLEQAGFEVISAMDGKEGKRMAVSDSPNLIILDLMLPELDGMEVCKQLRQENVFTPILMLTAKDDIFEKILGLEYGADDYMVKPFSPREVIARIKAILRRIQDSNENNPNYHEIDDVQIIVGDLKIYPRQYEAYFQDKILELTLKEFELLQYLAQNKDRVLSRDQLLHKVWNFDYSVDTRSVDVHISHLRDKLQGMGQEYIKTHRGVGYKLVEPVKIYE